MSWFRRSPPPPPEPPPPAEPEAHASPALGEHLARLHPDRRLQVLDLGPAVGANITFWSERFPCSVEVVDLVRSLAGVVAGDPVAAVDRVVPAEGEPVDLVLAWDVLNYLEREQIRRVSRHLAARCRPGAALFLMIATRPEMPAEPRRYRLRYAAGGEGRGEALELVYWEASPARRTAPRFKPAEVDALTPGFSVDRSLLLRHGVQEFLMLRDAD